MKYAKEHMINMLFGLQFMFTEHHTNIEVEQLDHFRNSRCSIFLNAHYKTLEKYHTF